MFCLFLLFLSCISLLQFPIILWLRIQNISNCVCIDPNPVQVMKRRSLRVETHMVLVGGFAVGCSDNALFYGHLRELLWSMWKRWKGKNWTLQRNRRCGEVPCRILTCEFLQMLWHLYYTTSIHPFSKLHFLSLYGSELHHCMYIYSIKHTYLLIPGLDFIWMKQISISVT